MYGNSKSDGGLGQSDRGASRRDFLRKAGNLGVASLAGAAALVANAEEFDAKTTWAEWFQGAYRLMTDKEKKESIARLEKRYSAQYGKKPLLWWCPARD